MHKKYKSIDRFNIKESSSSNKNILHLGGQNVILGPKFDIKKFFIDIEKKNENFQKRNINRLSLLYPIISPKNRKIYNISTDFSNISTSKNNNNQNYYTLDNDESMTSINNKNKNIYNNIYTNHSSKNIYVKNESKNNSIGIGGDNCFLTSLNIEKNNNSKKYKTIDAKDYLISFNSISNSGRPKKRIINNAKKIIRSFHISKVIKEIKEKYKAKESLELDNDYLAYSKKNMDSILVANDLLNHYKEKNEWDLKLKENNFHKFSNNNIKIFKQNILTKLINNEKEKVLENRELRDKNILDKKNAIIEEEKEFENIKSDQKLNYKIIENYRMKLEDYNKELYSLRYLMLNKVQNKEAEIMKKLFEIEQLREYAKFVNNMLGKDTQKFEKVIYPTNYEKKTELKILINNAFDVYSDYFNESKIEHSENKGNEPDIIYEEFLGLEDRIRHGIKEKDEVYEEIKKIKLKNNLVLDQIINKKKFLEEEYNNIKEDCDNTLNFILKEQKNDDIYLYSLAKELFIYILEIFSEQYSNIDTYKENINNQVLNLIKIRDLAEKSNNCITEKELFINESIAKIENYEKDDNLLFKEILESAKDRIILQRQKEARELRKIKERIQKIQAIKKLEKISFIMRRVEHPFHIKKKKKIEIDPKVILEKENNQLLTYQ